MVFETRLTTCTKRNRGEESAAFLPTPPHVHSVTIRSPVRLSPTFARNFDLNLFKDCITRGRFSFLQRSCFARDYERNQDVAMRASIDVQWNFPLTDSRHPFSFPPLYPSFFFIIFFFSLPKSHTNMRGSLFRIWDTRLCCKRNSSELKRNSSELFSSKNNGYQDYDSFVLQMSCVLYFPL